jgi:transcriptional regulator with XRE-family HTH domain
MDDDGAPALRDNLHMLGDFLRAKRRVIRPDRNGASLTRRRLVPGLSRDEVAAIADIGTTWYARLEAGRIPKPTLATITAVSDALELDEAERQFVMDLAGLTPRSARRGLSNSNLHSLTALIDPTQFASLSLWDRYLSPLGCNDVADAMYGNSEELDPIKRHPLVRLPQPRTIAFFGAAYENYARDLVGMFRRAYVSGEAPPHARAVFAAAHDIPIFTKYWDQHVVARSVTNGHDVFERHHWIVGSFRATAIDLFINEDETVLRIVAPADDESRSKFAQLAKLGTNTAAGLSLLAHDKLKNGSAIIRAIP